MNVGWEMEMIRRVVPIDPMRRNKWNFSWLLVSWYLCKYLIKLEFFQSRSTSFFFWNYKHQYWSCVRLPFQNSSLFVYARSRLFVCARWRGVLLQPLCVVKLRTYSLCTQGLDVIFCEALVNWICSKTVTSYLKFYSRIFLPLQWFSA